MTTINEALKTDLAFTDDLKVTSSGDLDVISGLDNLREAVLRRMLTRPGSLVHRPDYGVGLVDFKGAPVTLTTKRQLATRIREQLTLDPRIDRVVSVSVSSEDATPETITIVVRAEVAGYGETELEYTPFDTRI